MSPVWDMFPLESQMGCFPPEKICDDCGSVFFIPPSFTKQILVIKQLWSIQPIAVPEIPHVCGFKSTNFCASLISQRSLISFATREAGIARNLSLSSFLYHGCSGVGKPLRDPNHTLGYPIRSPWYPWKTPSDGETVMFHSANCVRNYQRLHPMISQYLLYPLSPYKFTYLSIHPSIHISIYI